MATRLQHAMLRKSALRTAMIVTIFAALSSTSASAQQPIREFESLEYPFAGFATYDAMGPVVFFNPRILQEIAAKVGPQVYPRLFEFLRAHEHAHFTVDQMPNARMMSQPDREIAASQIAARWLVDAGRHEAVRAAIWFHETHLRDGGGGHPPGAVEAQAIRQAVGW